MVNINGADSDGGASCDGAKMLGNRRVIGGGEIEVFLETTVFPWGTAR